MEWNIENEIRENLIKVYHQYGFNSYLGEDVTDLQIEINTLEKLVDEICKNEGITKKQFLFGGYVND